jgi:hypothetical protein
VEPLALVPVVFLAALFPQGLHDGADRGGAFRCRVAAVDAGAAERGPELEVAVAEAGEFPDVVVASGSRAAGAATNADSSATWHARRERVG